MEINNKRVHESQTRITRTLEFPSVLWGLGSILSLGIGVGGTPLFIDITKHPVIGGLGLGEVLSYKGGNRLLLSTPKLNAPSCPSTEVLRFICTRWIVIQMYQGEWERLLRRQRKRKYLHLQTFMFL